MTRLLALKEAGCHVLSVRLAALTSLCTVLFVLSFGSATVAVNRAMKRHDSLVRRHREQLTKYGSITGIQSLVQGFVVDRPVNVLRVLVRGSTAPWNESVLVQANGALTPVDQSRTGGMNAVGGLDFVFVVGVVMSLAALFTGAEAVAGEREMGQLRLVLSYSVPRHTYLCAKWFGGVGTICASCLVGWIVGMVVLGQQADFALTVEFYETAAVLLGAGVLYLSLSFGMGLLASCSIGETSTSLVASLMLWTATTVVVPSLAPTVSEAAVPAPSGGTLRAEVARIRHERWQARAEGSEKDVGITRERVLKIEEDYARRVTERSMVASSLAAVSPYISFKMACMKVCGVDASIDGRFQRALRAYSTAWGRYSNEKLPGPGGSFLLFWRVFGVDEPSVTFSDYPRFSFELPPLSVRLQAAAGDLVVLLVWIAILALASLAVFLRAEIT